MAAAAPVTLTPAKPGTDPLPAACRDTEFTAQIEAMGLSFVQKHTIMTLTPNPALDKSTACPMIQHTEKLRCQDVKAEPGGGGINVSRAIRKLGGDSEAIFLAGGTNGEIYEGLLDTELRGWHKKIEIAGETRESFTCFDETSGKEFRFNMPGPKVTPEEVQRTIDELDKFMDPPPGFLVLSGSLPVGVPDTYFIEIAKKAKAKGVKVILDTSGPQLLAAAQKSERDIYLCKPNQEELESMLNLKDTKLSYLKDQLDEIMGIQDDEHLIAAAKLAIDRGRTDIMVVSLGKAGALLVTREGEVEMMRGLTVPVKSAVGAGDTMLGAITLALAREWPIAMAVKFGLAAGAACVMTPGSELCRRTDTERLFSKMMKQTGVKYS
ncbi:putative 6-phosphofructokinase [Hyaloraphidium curvatum]|nr:putative 6-phosphofructokinase [Hyaloraphidium curvatum]